MFDNFWIVDDKGKIVNNRIDFVDTGVGLIATKTLTFVFENSNEPNFTVELFGRIKLYEVSVVAGETRILPAAQNNVNILDAAMTVVNHSGKVYKTYSVIVGWEPSSGELLDPDLDYMQVTIASNEINVSFYGDSVDVEDRHLVMLSNLKRGVTDEYMLALRSSDIDNDTRDNQLFNSKIREYLLNFFGLTAEIGSYRHLFKVLSFFEWDDDVRIKEYWKNLVDPEIWKATDVTSQVADVFTFEDGWKKTNLLGLFYDLNDPDGTFDTDGIPYYVKSAIAFDVMRIKLATLRTIIQRDFLADGLKIIDTVGEHTTFVGFDLNIFLNIVDFFEIRLNDDMRQFIDVDLDKTSDSKIYLSEHVALTDQDLYNDVSADELESKGQPTKLRYSIFTISKLDAELDTHVYTDWELVKRLYRGDFGVVSIKMTLKSPIPTHYYGYKIEIEREVAPGHWSRVLMTPLYSIGTVEDLRRYGLKSIGVYRVNLHFFDGYGGDAIVSDILGFEVQTAILQLKLMRQDWVTDSQVTKAIRDIQEIDTYEITDTDPITGTPVRDAASIDETDPAYRRYADISRLVNTSSPFIREIDLNLVPHYKLNLVPTIAYGRYFQMLVYDIIGDGTAGERTIKFKRYPGHQWDVVSYYYPADGMDYAFLNEFCKQAINASDVYSNSLFADFSYWIMNVSLDGSLTDTKPMLVMFSTIMDQMIEDNHVELTNVTLHGQNELSLFGKLESLVVIEADTLETGGHGSVANPTWASPDSPEVSSNLSIHLDGELVIDTDVATADELVAAVNAYILTSPGSMWIHKSGNRIVITSKKKIRLVHDRFGTHYDEPRNSHIDAFVECRLGDDQQIGAVVYAKIDEQEKYENSDIEWKTFDSLTGQLIHTDRNKMFRFAYMNPGIYDLQVSLFDRSNSLQMSTRKIGAVRIE